MGLMIHSLGELPANAKRAYYVYLLDYGWDEPLGEALHKNFDRMAALASHNNAVVMQGIVGSHFQDEVLSWHNINGQPGDEVLPAILITTRHPVQFRESGREWGADAKRTTDRMVLIPLRGTCESATDVALLIEKIFRDIKDKKALSEFEVARELMKGKDGALVDALILQPNVAGVGINFNYIIDFFTARRKT